MIIASASASRWATWPPAAAAGCSTTSRSVGSLIGITHPGLLPGLRAQVRSSRINLGWFPVHGRQDPRLDATHVTNFFVLDGIITREWDAAWDALSTWCCPASRWAPSRWRSSSGSPGPAVLEVLNEDYVRTAEAKGLTEKTIRRRHVLRNAMLPVVTTIGLQLAAAALRRGADRDGLRLQRHRQRSSPTRSSTGLSGAAGASS